MTGKPLKPWESDNPHRLLSNTDHRLHHTPVSETHKRRNADDYRATPAAERPAVLRRIVGAEYNHAYKGRTNILDEVADGVSELAARGELDGDNLEVLLDAVKNELEARKAAAAMTNAHKAKLAKTSPVRLGEHTVTRDKKPDEKTQTSGKLEGGLFGAKTMQNEPLFWVTGSGKIYPATPGLPAANQDDFGPYTRTQAEAALKRVQNEQVPETSDNIDTFLKNAPPADDKPTCKNEWALDPKKLVAYQDRIEYIASEAGVGMKEARAWGLKWFNVPDETQITMSASDALKFIKAQLPTSIDEQVAAAQESPAKPEPTPEPDDLTPPPDVLKDVPEVKHAETINPLAGITTLTGIPVEQIAARLDEKYPINAYKPIKMSGGRAGTDIAQDYVRDRIDEVFGPQGIGWKFDIHPILGAIVPEAIPDSKGGQTWNVTLLAHVFKYRIAVNGVFEWVELSPMSDNDTNADKGYAFRGAFTSLLKQVVRSLGGFNHLYRNEKLAAWAREQLNKR